MILQQLCRDADRLIEDESSRGYNWKPVKWLVHLNGGKVEWPPTPTVGTGRGSDPGKRMEMPDRKRSGTKAPPFLLADKRSFTWGVPDDPAKAERAASERERYLELLRRCVQETKSKAAAAVLAFLESWNPEAYPLPEDLAGPELTTFVVDGEVVVDEPEIRAFWARETGGDQEDAAEAAGDLRQCLVCGEQRRAVKRLPIPIKGIPNGQMAGVELVSFNETAFESYGGEAALNSPICLRCAERFAKALNALIRNRQTHIRIDPGIYVFWTAEGQSDSIVPLLNEPTPEQVKKLLDSARTGRSFDLPDPTPFYAFSLSANSSRAVVRNWLHTTVGEAAERLRAWFRLQQICDPYGAPGRPLGLRVLGWGLYHKTQDLRPEVTEALLRAALTGAPLPYYLLALAVRRCAVEGQVTYPRAALMKAVLLSQRMDRGTGPGEEEGWMERAGDHPARPAYHWGRLLAVLEAVQKTALGEKLNTTIVSRFYGAASTAPGTVFGRLMAGAQDHLKKIAGPLGKGGAAEGYRRQIEEISRHLPPESVSTAPLSLPDQALFALGYYHERAAIRARITAAAAAKKEKAAQLSMTEELENE